MADNSTSSIAEDVKTTNPVSVSNFTTALLSNFGIALLLLAVFCILRPQVKRVYAPRTYAIDDRKRVPALKKGLFSWVLPTVLTSNEKILKATNLDCYMILRTTKFLMIFFAFASLFSIALILPINLSFDTRQDLSRFSAANISQGSEWFWVHLVYYILSIGIVLYILFREAELFVKLRQKHLLKDSTEKHLKSHTVMLCGLGKDLTNQILLKKSLVALPGKVEKVSVMKDTKELEELIRRRDQLVYKLEACLSIYIIKLTKKYDSSKDKDSFKAPDLPTCTKTKFNPFKWEFSRKKFETIEYYCQLLLSHNKLLRTYKKEKARSLKPLDVGFVTFSSQISAHLTIQALLYHKIYHPSLKLLDTAPSDIVWKNLSIHQVNRRVRGYISMVISLVLILTWGSLSFLITSFFNSDTFRGFLKINQSSSNFFSGLNAFIAPLLLAGLVAVLPNFLRYLVDLEGSVRYSSIEFEVCRRFFWFLALTVFILPQISSTFSGLIKKVTTLLDSPSKLLNELNSIFLNSSSFFITYIALKSVVGSTVFLVNIPALFIRNIKPWLFSVTPRKRFQAEKPQRYEWESFVPHSMLAFLIGITYSAIAPFINIFCLIYYSLNYVYHHYQFLYVYDDDRFDYGGTTFISVVQCVFNSLYLAESIWLIMMVVNIRVNKSGIARVVVSVLAIIVTVLLDNHYKRRYLPLFKFLPVSLASRNSLNYTESDDLNEREALVKAASPADKSDSDNTRSLSFSRRYSKSLSSLESSKGLDVGIHSGELVGSGSGANQSEYFPSAKVEIRVSPYHDEYMSGDDVASIDILEKETANFERLKSNITNEKLDSFLQPSLQSNSFSLIWVPDDRTGKCNEIIQKVNEIGKGYFKVFSKSAFVNKRYRIGIDFDFNFGEREENYSK